jgi:hypothetical protein
MTGTSLLLILRPLLSLLQPKQKCQPSADSPLNLYLVSSSTGFNLQVAMTFSTRSTAFNPRHHTLFSTKQNHLSIQNT